MERRTSAVLCGFGAIYADFSTLMRMDECVTFLQASRTCRRTIEQLPIRIEYAQPRCLCCVSRLRAARRAPETQRGSARKTRNDVCAEFGEYRVHHAQDFS